MVNFFRRIRRTLAYKNRPFQYAKYAIGEILLVVLGILIALQINNWNEEKKLRSKEQQILHQLKDEFESNSLQLEEKITMRNEAMEAARYLLDLINTKQIQDEEQFYKSLFLLTQDPTFDPIKNDIIESENLRIIQNDTLIRALSMWSSDVYQVQEIELQYQKIRTEVIIPCYNRLGITRNVQHNMWKDGYAPTYALDKTKKNKLFIGQTKKQLYTQKILNDVELEGVISIAISYHNIANIQSLTLSERIKAILGLLDREIDPDKSE